MNIEERNAVLKFLYREEANKGLFSDSAVVNKIISKHNSQIEYEEMTDSQRRIILKNIIINYLVNDLLNSLAIDFVNGSPEKRLFRIKEVAHQRYLSLTEDERILIIKKINNN